MDLAQAMDSRSSIRGYKPTPVPREVLVQILETALRAPSSYNIQPWEIHIVGGSVMKELTRTLEHQVLSGAEPGMDFPLEAFAEFQKSRRIELAKGLLQLAGIAREDKDRRQQWMLRMFRFFDAPNAIIINIDHLEEGSGGHYFMFSIGALAQSIALTAVSFGLGTCLDLAPMGYARVIKSVLGIPESKKLAMAMAIGYPDWDFAPNTFRTDRQPLDDIASWHGV